LISKTAYFSTLIGCHATSLKESQKLDYRENSRKYLPFGEKIVKIGPVDTEIALLILKKEEINASKIGSGHLEN